MRWIWMTAMLAACGGGETPTTPAEKPVETPKVDELRAKAGAMFGALPTEMLAEGRELSDARIALGRMLYYDARLSKNHDVSCNTCHDLATWGVDHAPTSTGHKAQKGGRNAPTTYNAAMHIAQFWDGRAKDVEDQAKGPPLNPIEMAMADAGAVETTFRSIPGYAEPFKTAFPGEEQPVTFDNLAVAIGAFERKLVTPDPFDKWLGGDDAAMTAEQKAGLQTFMDVGCTTCHGGKALGGMMYQKLGLVKPYETADRGRAALTGNDAEAFMFKVPSLRNIAKTGPYLHDGSIATLDESIRLMGSYQLGKDLTDEQVNSIATFFDALTGPIPTEYIAKPELPADGPATPAADPS